MRLEVLQSRNPGRAMSHFAVAVVLPMLLAPSSTFAQPLEEEEAKLVASDGAAEDNFGFSVAISGNVAVVGASGSDDQGSNSGAAYVYRYNGTVWAEEKKLLASDVKGFDNFGASVAVSSSSDVVVVGAPEGLRPGSAYVYRYDGKAWREEAKLVGLDSPGFRSFGSSVAISGDVVAVGDEDRTNEILIGAGAVYVYRYDGSGWVLEAELLPSGVAAALGRSVAVSDGVLIAGAPRSLFNGSSSGAVVLYRYDGSGWVEEATLTITGGHQFDNFGHSVAISGDSAIAGAWGRDVENGEDAGAAYIIRYDGTSWVGEGELLASDGSNDDRFGYSVAISGDVAVVGAWQDNDNGFLSGSAYLFRREGTAWVEEAKLPASDGAPSDGFGVSIAMSDDVAVVGAVDRLTAPPDSAYVYRLPEPSPRSLQLVAFGLLALLSGRRCERAWAKRLLSH